MARIKLASWTKYYINWPILISDKILVPIWHPMSWASIAWISLSILLFLSSHNNGPLKLCLQYVITFLTQSLKFFDSSVTILADRSGSQVNQSNDLTHDNNFYLSFFSCACDNYHGQSILVCKRFIFTHNSKLQSTIGGNQGSKDFEHLITLHPR